nr:NAD(+) diphosphatase [uncultured Butyrivibrio sp.]
MLQDISPYIFDNHFYPEKRPDNNSRLIVFRGRIPEKEVLVKESDEGNIELPCLGDLKEIDPDKAIYLFALGDESFFLIPEENEIQQNGSDLRFSKMTELRRAGLEPRYYIFALYTAFHLNEWYESSNFCGRCGAPTINDTSERARVCPECGHKIYPRINPAVIIGVVDKDTNRILLTKYRTGFSQNALVAGFTEIGETLEETVKREVMEEVGLNVTNIRYYKSQPWGIALDILAGFYCDVDGNRQIQMDESELKYAKWVSAEDIILQNPDYSLTNEMMRLFKEKGYEGTC